MICICHHAPSVQPGCPVHDPGGRTLPDGIAAVTRVYSGTTVTAYVCLTCQATVDPDAHEPGSQGCEATRAERLISRADA